VVLTATCREASRPHWDSNRRPRLRASRCLRLGFSLDWKHGSHRDPAGRAQHWGENMDDLWLALYWTGPIGVGAFLAGLGVLFWGISRIQDVGRKKKESEKVGS
jgi:hypothetical protein